MFTRHVDDSLSRYCDGELSTADRQRVDEARSGQLGIFVHDDWLAEDDHAYVAVGEGRQPTSKSGTEG